MPSPRQIFQKVLAFFRRLFNLDADKLRLHVVPSEKTVNVLAAIHWAEARLGWELKPTTLVVNFVPGTDHVGNFWGKENERGRVVGAYAVNHFGHYSIVAYTDPNGNERLEELAHEVGHVLLWQKQIVGSEEHHKRLREAGFESQ